MHSDRSIGTESDLGRWEASSLAGVSAGQWKGKDKGEGPYRNRAGGTGRLTCVGWQEEAVDTLGLIAWDTESWGR